MQNFTMSVLIKFHVDMSIDSEATADQTLTNFYTFMWRFLVEGN